MPAEPACRRQWIGSSVLRMLQIVSCDRHPEPMNWITQFYCNLAINPIRRHSCNPTDWLSFKSVSCVELAFFCFSQAGQKSSLVLLSVQVCYHEALPLCSRFFPYMALLQSLVLVASGSFWLHFPHTSSRIEQFLAILAKCCESPWTSQALSHAARQENIQEVKRRPPQPPPSSDSSSPPVNRTYRSSIDSGTDSPFLKRSDSASLAGPPSPCPSTISCNSTMSSISVGSGEHFPVSKPSVIVDRPREVIILDKSDGEQARALFERVRKFRSHCESSAVIYKVRESLFSLWLVTPSTILWYPNYLFCIVRHFFLHALLFNERNILICNNLLFRFFLKSVTNSYSCRLSFYNESSCLIEHCQTLQLTPFCLFRSTWLRQYSNYWWLCWLWVTPSLFSAPSPLTTSVTSGRALWWAMPPLNVSTCSHRSWPNC